MLGPGKLFPPVHRLLSLWAILAALGAAVPAAAEGRHDPFLRCDFEDGRQVVLAENGAGTLWIEGAERAPAMNFADKRRDDNTLVTVVAYLAGGLVRLDVYAPLRPPDSGPHPEPLDALLSHTRPAGATLEITTTHGKCAEFHG